MTGDAERGIRLRMRPSRMTLVGVVAVLGSILFAPGVSATASAADFNPTAGTYTIDTTSNPPTLTGTDGTTITGADENGVAVFSFGNVDIPAGVTVNASGSLPLEIAATGSFSLSGTINGSGASAVARMPGPNASGPGGGAGGADGSSPGGGSGGGGVASTAINGGGGGGFGGAGAPGGVCVSGFSCPPGGTAGTGGNAYGNLVNLLQGGSGGGGAVLTGTEGEGGGGGGGAIELSGDTLTIASTGQVLADGGGGDSYVGASGGGSGGGILIHGNTVDVSGTLSAVGGPGGAGGCCGDGGGGGGGRIAYEFATLVASGTANVAGGASGSRSTGGCNPTPPYCPAGAPSTGATGAEGLVSTVQGATATTDTASGVSLSSATLNGQVDPDGTNTTYHFEYGTTSSYGSQVPGSDTVVGSDSTGHPVSQTLTGLQPDTTYHYRVVATDAYGIVSRGADQMFTTPQDPGPSVATDTASGVSVTGATLNGQVDPDGTDTTYQFEYGTTSSYGSQVPGSDTVVGSDSTGHAVSQTLTGLQPDTTYHYRVVATDAFGIVSRGADETFGTSPRPPATMSATSSTAGPTATLVLQCQSQFGQGCAGTYVVSAHEKTVGSSVVATSARAAVKKKVKSNPKPVPKTVQVTLGSGSYNLASGKSETITFTLNATGKRLLGQFAALPATFTFTASSGTTPAQKTITFAYSKIATPISLRWTPASGYVSFTRLLVNGIPKHGDVLVTCSGSGCRFGQKTFQGRSKVSVTKLFHAARLKPGAKVQVWVTAPNSIGKVEVFSVTRKLGLVASKECLPPGSVKPAACTA